MSSMGRDSRFEFGVRWDANSPSNEVNGYTNQEFIAGICTRYLNLTFLNSSSLDIQCAHRISNKLTEICALTYSHSLDQCVDCA